MQKSTGRDIRAKLQASEHSLYNGKCGLIGQKHALFKHSSFQKQNQGRAGKKKWRSPNRKPEPVAFAVRYKPAHS